MTPKSGGDASSSSWGEGYKPGRIIFVRLFLLVLFILFDTPSPASTRSIPQFQLQPQLDEARPAALAIVLPPRQPFPILDTNPVRHRLVPVNRDTNGSFEDADTCSIVVGGFASFEIELGGDLRSDLVCRIAFHEYTRVLRVSRLL